MTNPRNSPYAAARQRVFEIADTLESAQRRALAQELTLREKFKVTTHNVNIDSSISTRARVDSTSDSRVVNNVMRHEYRVLSDAEKDYMQRIKDKGLEFHQLVSGLGTSRELSLALTKIEEGVMWAVKHVTK